MKKLFLYSFIFGIIYINLSLSQDLNLFNLKLSEYSTKAKTLSKKQLSDTDINYLSDSAWSIIEDMKNKALTEKLKTDDIDIKYSGNKNFPPLEGVNKSDQKIIKFTIACSILYRYITKDIVKSIVKKSPLEMISIIKELDIFFKFISANPENFGHGVFSEKQNKNTVILATNDAILRIMKVLIYTELLGEHCLVYKLSRLTSYLCNNYENITPENFQTQIDNLKRFPIDNSRIALYISERIK